MIPAVEQTHAVRDLAIKLLQDDMRLMGVDDITALLIAHAEEIRDVLHPFDSGVRVTYVESAAQSVSTDR